MDANLFVRCGVKDELSLSFKDRQFTELFPPPNLSLTHST